MTGALSSEEHPVCSRCSINAEKKCDIAARVWVMASIEPRIPTFFFFCLFVFRAEPKHMEIPRLEVQSELQPLAYATATARWDPSHVSDLHHSSRQHRILHPLRGPGIKPATSWFLVGFVSAEPQQELPNNTSYYLDYNKSHREK